MKPITTQNRTCRTRAILLNASLLLGLALCNPSYAVTATLHTNFGSSFQSIGLVPNETAEFKANDGDPPLTLSFRELFPRHQPERTYGIHAEATADAVFGTLSAYAFAEIGGTVSDFSVGIYTEASLLAQDFLQVKSGSLPKGSPVLLDFNLDLQGNGHVSSQFKVALIIPGGGGATSGKLTLQYSDPGDGNVSKLTHGTVAAAVGDIFTIEYSLLASAGVSGFGLSTQTQNVFAASDYSHTAHFYAQSTTPDAFIAATSGHDFTAPAAVPLPMSLYLMVPALSLLRWRRPAALEFVAKGGYLPLCV